MLNRLLKEQIEIFFGNEEIPEKYMDFFKSIGNTYTRLQKESRMLERMVDLGSEELIKLNTKLKKESNLLKETQNEVSKLFENINIVFFSFDLIKNRFNQMSIACEKIYGYKPVEFITDIDLWKTVIHPDDKSLLKFHDQKLALGRPLTYQYRIIHKNGSVRWVESKVTPTFDATGCLVRKEGIVTDITEKKLAEQKVLQTERYLLEAQQLGKMGNWNIDMVKKETFWSKGLKDMYGVDADFVPTFSKFIALVHPEDKAMVSDALSKAAATGSADDVIYRLIRADNGNERIIHSILRTEMNSTGRIIRIYGLSQDITDRKAAESKIGQLNVLMYQISHDLRGPLNSAKNYIYLARRRVDNKTAHEYLAKINTSYIKMEQRVMSLLDIQRMNRTNVNTEKVNLCSLIKDIILSIDGLKGFEEVEITPDIKIPCMIYCDRQFLHSIIHNLLSNAIIHRKRSPDAYVKISARAKKDVLTLKVSDNGEGIPAHMRDKIFDKFVKGANSADGAGLGLYIVSDLVKRLNGRITFETEENKGTTFIVELPYMPDNSDSAEVHEAPIMARA